MEGARYTCRACGQTGNHIGFEADMEEDATLDDVILESFKEGIQLELLLDQFLPSPSLIHSEMNGSPKSDGPTHATVAGYPGSRACFICSEFDRLGYEPNNPIARLLPPII